MSFFSRLANKSRQDDPSRVSTKSMFIGIPEAEGEARFSSQIRLVDVFEDFLDIFEKFAGVNFLLTGRKGSGKTAVAEFILHNANKEANIFSTIIKASDLDLEKLVQIGQKKTDSSEEKFLFEWIILVTLANLMTENEAVKNLREYSYLKNFLDRNSGMVDIQSMKVEEVLEKKHRSLDIQPFKKLFKIVFGKDFEITRKKAFFYELIPGLKRVLFEILTSKDDFHNEYFIIFDDLDIGFRESDQSSVENLINLIRVAKDINLNFFGKIPNSGKVLILLRNDIKRILTETVEGNADSAKIFSSYEIPISWYQHDRFKRDENLLPIKKFLNKRIKINFEKKGYEFDQRDPWRSFISSDVGDDKGSFKYLLDYTFYRPRDLILFFKPIDSMDFNIPIDKDDFTKLLSLYSKEISLEVQNELSAKFSQESITSIFSALRARKYRQPFTFEELESELIKFELDYPIEEAVEELYEYGIIGNYQRSANGKFISFKYRDNPDIPKPVSFEEKFILHNSLNTYFELY